MTKTTWRPYPFTNREPVLTNAQRVQKMLLTHGAMTKNEMMHRAGIKDPSTIKRILAQIGAVQVGTRKANNNQMVDVYGYNSDTYTQGEPCNQ